VKIPISEETLLEDNCLVSPERRKISFTSLTEEEAPKPKDIVGLDAEFVSLNQVGTMYEKLSVAKFSCVVHMV
jgi:hypothetical protein